MYTDPIHVHTTTSRVFPLIDPKDFPQTWELKCVNEEISEKTIRKLVAVLLFDATMQPIRVPMVRTLKPGKKQV